MDQIKILYYDYCKTYHIEPNETILGEIQKYCKKKKKFSD
jgi:hypothetical protein